jgi:hypothetical protein
MPDPRRLMAVASAVAAVALLYLLLALPNQPGVFTPAGLRRFPLELPAILLLLMATPARLLGPLRTVLAATLTVVTALKLADLGTETAFLRPFNPVLDGNLISAAWRLGSGSVGRPFALGAVLALVATLALLTCATWWAIGRIARLAPARKPVLAALALPALLVAGLDASGARNPPGYARTSQMAWQHLRDGWHARDNLAHFRTLAAADAYAGLPPGSILPALRGTDVLLVFVESYGRSALGNPRYGPTTAAALRDSEAEITAAGFAARSGFLTAPIVGGQSWLAHASVLSGLSIDNEGRYRALLESPRRTLLHLAREAGWQTAAVMPAMTFAWPEADYFGYDHVLAAADLGYQGLPFDWVTMPDQFTLASFERRLLAPRPRKPVFAEIALISSHAPWTPLPSLLPWDAIGDGAVYGGAATASDAASVVWLDEDRVRDQYRQSSSYVLRVIGGFAARRAADPPLIFVLGDHQPVSFVSEDSTNRDVPIHVIGPPSAISRLDAWGWTPGMVPAPATPAWPMDAFRDHFLAAFGTETVPHVQSAAAP